MVAEFERLGYESGQKTAYACKREVRRAHKEDLSMLAGIKMEAVIDEAHNPIYHLASWKAGFWSGFMDRAEELR